MDAEELMLCNYLDSRSVGEVNFLSAFLEPDELKYVNFFIFNKNF
jgi:hypothetical protein